MVEKAGRNDPCPCGSGKKYKQCCMLKEAKPGKKKLTATWINQPRPPNLIERTFGAAVTEAQNEKPPVPTRNYKVKQPENENS